ncbi:hypothetical protein GBA52_023776 [Prunus armeniaca]|nr:hypothetical protein GBA52_023776 [Prunus armeniaca]
MASLLGGSASAEHATVGLCKGVADTEDEDDLFEIDLDSVDSIPPPQYYGGNYFTATWKCTACQLPTAGNGYLPCSSNDFQVIVILTGGGSQCCNDAEAYALGAASWSAILGGSRASPKGSETQM